MFNRKYLESSKKKNTFKEHRDKNSRYNVISKFMDNAEYERALDLLVEFILDYPDDYYARFDYALCLIRTGQPKTGVLELEMLRKKTKKRILAIYSTLIDYYLRNTMNERVESLIEEAEKVLPSFDIKYLKIKYYLYTGRLADASVIIDNLSLKNAREEAKINTLRIIFYGNEYMKKHKKELEKEIDLYLRKKLISQDTARRAYLKLYTSCLDDEKAYEYIEKDLSKGIKQLLISYNICNRLGKKYEAQKYLNLINSYEIPENATITKIQILYINGKTKEAFELCKEQSLLGDLESVEFLYRYGIKLDRLDEVIEVIEKILDGRFIGNSLLVNAIERLLGLYIYKKRFEDAYNLLEKYNMYLSVKHREEYYTYLCKRLNKWYSANTDVDTYSIKQLRNYSYDRAVSHIDRHNYKDDKKFIHTLFNDKLSGEYIIEFVRPYLTRENLYELGTVEKYEIDCTDLDINEKKLVVGKITGTDDIIFCFPSKSYLEEIENEDEIEKQEPKQISPLTKFKNKYNL